MPRGSADNSEGYEAGAGAGWGVSAPAEAHTPDGAAVRLPLVRYLACRAVSRDSRKLDVARPAS